MVHCSVCHYVPMPQRALTYASVSWIQTLTCWGRKKIKHKPVTILGSLGLSNHSMHSHLIPVLLLLRALLPLSSRRAALWPPKDEFRNKVILLGSFPSPPTYNTPPLKTCKAPNNATSLKVPDLSPGLIKIKSIGTCSLYQQTSRWKRKSQKDKMLLASS